VALALLVQVAIDHGQQLGCVTATEASLRAKGLVVPQEEGSLHDLKMLGRDTVGEEQEKLSLEFVQLFLAQELEYLLQLIHEEDLRNFERLTHVGVQDDH